MLKEKTGIGPGLLFMVTYVTMFGFGVVQAPYVAAKYIGANGYWGLVLAFALSLLMIKLIQIMGQAFPGKSLVQLLSIGFGAWAGKILSLLYLFFVLVLLVWASRSISEFISVYFLPRTPMWCSVLLFLIVSTFAAHQGIEGLSRLAAFIFPLTLLFSLLPILFSFQGFQLDHIRPILFIEGERFAFGALQLYYPFIPLILIPMLFPYLTKRENMPRVLMGASALAFIMILLVIVSGLGNYGALGVLRYSWLTFDLIRKANIPFVLQTFGLFFAATWLSQALAGTGFIYYILAEGVAQVTHALNYKWFTLILFLPAFYMTLWFPSVVDTRMILPGLRIAGIALSFFLPLIIVGSFILRRGGEKRAS